MTTPCTHDHLDMDGTCHACGADCRGIGGTIPNQPDIADALQAAAERATPGEHTFDLLMEGAILYFDGKPSGLRKSLNKFAPIADREFIALCTRENILALLARLKSAEAVVAAARELQKVRETGYEVRECPGLYGDAIDALQAALAATGKAVPE
jgi:hypothetical protein